jgi:hypothetical protein
VLFITPRQRDHARCLWMADQHRRGRQIVVSCTCSCHAGIIEILVSTLGSKPPASKWAKYHILGNGAINMFAPACIHSQRSEPPSKMSFLHERICSRWCPWSIWIDINMIIQRSRSLCAAWKGLRRVTSAGGSITIVSWRVSGPEASGPCKMTSKAWLRISRAVRS